MTRRALMLGIALASIATPADARKRYKVYVRRAKTPQPEPRAEPTTVQTIRIIPLPAKLAPTWKDHWLERIRGAIGFGKAPIQ